MYIGLHLKVPLILVWY